MDKYIKRDFDSQYFSYGNVDFDFRYYNLARCDLERIDYFLTSLFEVLGDVERFEIIADIYLYDYFNYFKRG